VAYTKVIPLSDCVVLLSPTFIFSFFLMKFSSLELRPNYNYFSSQII